MLDRNAGSRVCKISPSIEIYFDQECHAHAVLIVKAAARTLDISVYTYDLYDFTEAVIEAARRGVRVRMIFDKNQQNCCKNAHARIKSLLATPNIEARNSFGTKGNHWKAIVVDNAYVLIGSANWSENSRTNMNEAAIGTSSRWIVDACLGKFDSHFEAYARAPMTLADLPDAAERDAAKGRGRGPRFDTTRVVQGA